MTKKDTYAVKDNGVTLYFLKYTYAIVDIDVEPGVEIVTFIGADGVTPYNITYRVSLMDVYKQFPDVKEIVIGSNIDDIDFRNDMFPNVKVVKSKSKHFKDDCDMLVQIEYNKELSLLNTFHRDTGAEIDMSGIRNIREYAFEGLIDCKLLNTEKIKHVGKNAFHGATIEGSSNDDAVIINNVLISIPENESTVHIPKSVKNISASADFRDVKDIHIEEVSVLNAFYYSADLRNLRNLYLDTEDMIDILRLREYLDRYSMFNGLKNVYIEKDNKFFKDVNGVIYSKDGRILYYAPKGKKGILNIPDGTKIISGNALQHAGIRELNIPDSVEYIEKSAFFDCSRLKKVNLGRGIKELGCNVGHNVYYSAGIFASCSSLEEIDIPPQVEIINGGTFSLCKSLKKVTLHEGLKQIHNEAFIGCGLEEITLPASLSLLGEKSLFGISKINLAPGCNARHLATAIMTKPDFTNQQIADEYEKRIITVNFEGKGTAYFPQYASNDKIEDINLFFNNNEFDKDIAETLYEYATSPKAKQDIGLYVYKLTKRDDIGAYLRRASKSFATRLIKEGNEEELIEFLKLDLMTPNAMKSVLKEAEANGAASAAAYLISALGKEKSSTFRV